MPHKYHVTLPGMEVSLKNKLYAVIDKIIVPITAEIIK